MRVDELLLAAAAAMSDNAIVRFVAYYGKNNVSVHTRMWTHTKIRNEELISIQGVTTSIGKLKLGPESNRRRL